MPRVEIEQLAPARATAPAAEPPLDLVKADLPAESLRDLQGDQAGEVAARRIATARVQG
jgi:hypothetical protein